MTSKIVDAYSKVFEDKQKVLFVFAHPDDAEIYAGGTIARLTSEGKEVRVIKVTTGNKGSRQNAITEFELKNTRLHEDSNAMKRLGIKNENNVYLQLGDGEIENNLETIEKLANQIRNFKPDIVVTHNPEKVFIRFSKGVNWVNHRDHRNTGKSVIDAAYPYSRDLLFFPQQLEDKQNSPHIVTEFLIVDSYGHIDEINIDVTKFVTHRNEALACHSSQYSLEDAQDSTVFFTKLDDSEKRYERFRHVIAD